MDFLVVDLGFGAGLAVAGAVVEAASLWSAMMGTILLRLAGESAMIAGALWRTNCPHLARPCNGRVAEDRKDKYKRRTKRDNQSIGKRGAEKEEDQGWTLGWTLATGVDFPRRYGAVAQN